MASAKITQRELKNLANRADIFDATECSWEECNRIRKEENGFTQICYASGIYGCNGYLIKGENTGKLYAVTARNTAMFTLY